MNTKSQGAGRPSDHVHVITKANVHCCPFYCRAINVQIAARSDSATAMNDQVR